MGFENGHLLRCTFSAIGPGANEQVMTLHYDLENATAEPANDPQTLADRLRDDVRSLLIAQLNGDWSVQPVQIVDEIDPQNPTAPRSSWQSGTVTSGTLSSSSDFLPPGCAPIIRLKSDRIGRRFNGRCWLLGTYNEGSQNGGSWVSGVISGILQPIADAIPVQPDIAEGESTSTANLCIYSRTQRAANLDPYASHVTAKQVVGLVHFLRRRSLYA